MVAPKSGSVRTTAVVVAFSVVLGFVLACASTTSDRAVASVVSLTNVRVDSGDEGTTVTLVGLSAPIFTAVYDQDLQVVVVELASVEAAGAMDRVEVYDGIIDYITTSTYSEEGGESITRVEIALGTEASYTVSTSEEGLRIDLTEAVGPMASDDDMDEGDPWSDAGDTVGSTDVALTDLADPFSTEAAQPQIEIEPPPVATSLLAVEVKTLESGALIHLKANGSIWAVESFTLDNPDRIVVDLPNLKSDAPIDTILVDHPMIKRVRVGAHANKVRIVIDAGTESLGSLGRSIKPSADGLYLAVGSGEEVEVALADGLGAAEAAWNEQFLGRLELSASSDPGDEQAVEEGDWAEGDSPAQAWTGDEDEADSLADADWPDAAEASDETAAEGMELAEVTPIDQPAASSPRTVIHGVHYTAMDDLDRIAVLSEAAVDYKVHAPDADTLIVSLFGATISPQIAGRIRGQAGGPVSLITIFEQPDVGGSEVRVVVTRAPNQEPLISRRGSLLFIDFERLGVAAAEPPAFPQDEMVGLTLSSIDDPAMPQASEWEESVAEDGMSETPEAGEQLVAQSVSFDELPEFSENPSLDGPAGIDQGFAEGELDRLAEDDEFAGLSGSLDDFDDFDDPAFDMAGPASLEPPAAVELLQEGGLVDGKQYEGRRISLDFNNVPISDVLRLIAEVSDLNLIAGDEVKGAVTIRLVDVPWDQALDVVLLTKGLGFVRVGNILRVAPSDILAAEEELRLQERRNKEKLEDLMVKLLPVNYAAVKDMQKLVKRLLSSRGTVNIDERTNTLIMKDIASVIDESVALIRAIDTETPQVMIEAKIVEANLNFARELGSTWSLASQPFVDPFSGSVVRDDLGSKNFRFHGSNSVAFSNPITMTPTALMDLGAFLLDEKLDINLALRAAESMGEGKVISSPRIVTLDNGEATIEQGVSIPFQTFEGGDAKLEFIDAVLSLKVTPHITSDRSIIMDIEVTRNAPDDSVPTPTGSPAIAKAEASTEALVKDGQTLVLGGIYTIDKTERESRVPYLYRLPVIGAAFRSKELTDLRKELLIFVTQRIVKSPSLADRG